MFVSTTTSLRGKIGYKGNVELMKQAGFTAYDIGLARGDGGPAIIEDEFIGDDYREKALELREFADQIGIVCNQAHAPFGSHYGDATPDTPLFQMTVRSMEIASILGAKNIVVHPMQFLHYPYYIHELKEINRRFYSDLLPYAEEYQITMLTENMWRNQPVSEQIIPSTCAWAEEFCAYIDMIDSPYMKGCLDIGHAVLTGENLTRIITMLGSDRLAGLHIHDVTPTADSHTLPYTQSVDFSEMLSALKSIGYRGDITFESANFERKFPQELYLSALRLTADVGHYFKHCLEA